MKATRKIILIVLFALLANSTQSNAQNSIVSRWENFEKVIQKAKDACNNAGKEIKHHFPYGRKLIQGRQ